MKWVSFSTFEATGKFVEVEAPLTDYDPPPCPLFLFDDYYPDTAFFNPSLFGTLDALTSHRASRLHVAILSFRFEPYQFRGPPIYS